MGLKIQAHKDVYFFIEALIDESLSSEGEKQESSGGLGAVLKF